MSRLASLKWNVLWPVASVLLLALALGIYQIEAHRRTVGRIGAVAAMRDQLDRAMAQLRNRHLLTIRRARGALSKSDQRVALLAWTSRHYSDEMERLLDGASRTITSAAGRVDNPRLRKDLERVREQLRGVGRQTQEVSAALDLLLGAASADDSEALAAGTEELDRADAAMGAALGRTENLIQRASNWQALEIARTPTGSAWPFLLLLACCAPLAFWLATRPLRRVAALTGVRGEPGTPHSREERDLQLLLERLRRENVELTDRLDTLGLESERAAQSGRRLERELALLRLYNENLVNSLRSAIVVTDANGVLTGFNRVARSLLGLRDEQIGSPIEELSIYRAVASRSASAREQLQAAMEGTGLRLEGIAFSADADTGGDTGDGDTEILLDLTIVPYRDEGGAARGLLWVSDDVTDAMRTKNQLLAAEHLATVGRLSAQVAHEIRNPLSAIGLNAELLAEELGIAPGAVGSGADEVMPSERAEEARALVRGIVSEVERLSQVTESYLELARMPLPECRDADLNQLVSDLFAMVSQEMKAHAVRVELDLGSPPPRAWVDPGQLRQAMINIVRNSREAMPDGGTLHVKTTSNGNYSRLIFTDSGVGIDPEAARRAFEPFYSTKPNGTGLGLSLTEQIMVEHNGKIEIAPRATRGTSVTLTLPRQAVDD